MIAGKTYIARQCSGMLVETHVRIRETQAPKRNRLGYWLLGLLAVVWFLI